MLNTFFMKDKMSTFPTCKITVLKTLYHEDLSKEYRHPHVDHGSCKFFKVGDEFIVNYLSERPANFGCDWAWDDDLRRYTQNPDDLNDTR